MSVPDVAIAERVEREMPRASASMSSLLGRASRSLASNHLLIALLDQAIVSGTSFVTSVLIGRILTHEDLGLYFAILNVALFVRGVQEQMIGAPYTVHHARMGARANAYAGSTMVQFAGHSVAALAGILLVAAAAWGAGKSDLALAALLVLVAISPFYLLRELMRQISFARLRMGQALAMDGAAGIVQLGLLGLLAAVDSLTVATAMATMGAAAFAGLVAWFACGNAHIAFVRSEWRDDWVCNWRFGRWSVLSFLVGSTTPLIIPWILLIAQGKGATGHFAAAWTLVGVVNLFIAGYCNYLTPKAAHEFAHGGLPAIHRLLARTAILFAVLLVPLCAAAIPFGDEIAVLVFGAEFTAAGPVLAILAVCTLVRSLGMIAGNGLWAANLPQKNLVADVAMFAITLGVGPFLIVVDGATGAAWSLLCGLVPAAALRWILFARINPSSETVTAATVGS